MGRWSDDIGYAVITFRLALLLCWLNNPSFFFLADRDWILYLKFFTSKEKHGFCLFLIISTPLSLGKKQRGEKSRPTEERFSNRFQ
ncbi:hypothetical protein BDV40DRAFT_9212 [Aspergillus tamarii]|uniref:Uncharacterized protein n=1 Tax=Aspergillus tamarii TaxID=41984 RepID=A0A5N6UJI8_ASPTM|nr:hypothetical protein BDV40DRAFT_9212 [Aspergillus tamarii]